MVKKNETKPVKLEEWKRQANPGAAYAECAKALVHYSSKTVNSNAAAAGVRLAASDVYDGPYLAVSTVGPAKVPVDYVRGANPDAALVKQIEAVRDPVQRARFFDVPAEEEEAIKVAISSMDTPSEYGLDWIDARLRQVLFPTKGTPEEEHYVAITPLNSAGLAELVRRRIEGEYTARDEAGKPRLYRATAQLGYGGSNPQNVGRWVRSMQRTLICLPPSNDPQVRRAWAIYFKGPGIATALRPLLDDYALWHHRLMGQYRGQMPGDLQHRQAEQELLTSVARRALALGAEFGTEQARHLEPGNLTDADGDISIIERALVDKTLRDHQFKSQLAQWVAALISTHRYRAPGGGELHQTGISSDDAARLAGVIEETLR